MPLPSFFRSIRAKLLLIALLLMLIPFIGFRFVQEMEGYLREGQQQVLVSAAKLLSATLSDRPQLFRTVGEFPDATNEAANQAAEAERRQLLALFGSADPAVAANLGGAYVPSEEVERILSVVAGSASRIWVVDVHSRVRGLAGSLNPPTAAARTSEPSILARIYAALIRPLVRLLTSDPATPALEEINAAATAVMAQVDRALVGEPTARQREAGKGALIVSVAQPIWQGDNIVGAVVLEETTASGQSIKVAALESLLATTLIVFLAGFVALVGFAWLLASRVRRLQREADRAIDQHGRIQGAISGSANRDEIGALAQTLQATLARLARYNDYLEQMAARLSHELRTPVAVVRSSLDNLRQGNLPAADRVYLDRAEEGVARLSSLIARMSEATQLEGLLQGADREQFDLARLVEGCVAGYRLAYAGHDIRLQRADSEPIPCHGIPDTLAQMLDKLVQNAIDFAAEGTPIRIDLSVRAGKVLLAVENHGPLLKPDIAETLFVSMVSARATSASRDGHLGLGLYIVRLVAEFHGGKVEAGNLADGSGVRFTVTLPLRG